MEKTMLQQKSRSGDDKGHEMDFLNHIDGAEIFRNLFEYSTVGMSITSLDGRLHANATYCEMLGYTKEEFLDRKWTDFTYPDDIEYNNQLITNLLTEGKQSVRWEKRYLHKDGSIIWVDIHTFLFRDANGNPLHFITTVNDITKRKVYEEALSRSEQRYRTLIREMNEGITILDSKGFFQFANHAAETILGVEKESLTGTDARNILGHPLFDFIQREILTGAGLEKKTFEYEFKLTDGSEKIVTGSATSGFDEQNRIETLLLLRDITTRKMAENEIRSQNEKLQISNAEKDKFFAILAHDLRSPLSSFLGLAEVMSEDINTMTMSEIEEISKSLYLSATNLYQLLENLLEWSILQRGALKYMPEPTSLSRIVLRSIEPLQEAARRKNIDLKLNLDKSMNVTCDLKMTETIFRNLISNAFKYTNPGGTVEVSARELAGDETEILISDTGIGMSSELQAKLFKVNEQVSRKGTEGESSSGLGLLICKEFAERQEGRLWAESEENQGSTFHFTLKNS